MVAPHFILSGYYYFIETASRTDCDLMIKNNKLYYSMFASVVLSISSNLRCIQINISLHLPGLLM